MNEANQFFLIEAFRIQKLDTKKKEKKSAFKVFVSIIIICEVPA